jgi:hypothetical protein
LKPRENYFLLLFSVVVVVVVVVVIVVVVVLFCFACFFHKFGFRSFSRQVKKMETDLEMRGGGRDGGGVGGWVGGVGAGGWKVQVKTS